jgi:Raf kinase inhibitor-like YbhB/YbcL family protein
MRRVLAASLAVVAAGLAACGDDGRELRAPSADQTTTSSTASTAPSTSTTLATTATTAGSDTTEVAAGTGGAGGGGDPGAPASTSPPATAELRLTSAAFADGQPIPLEYTCRGTDVSPPLAWTGLPAGTAELALVVRDPDADGFVHWVITGLSPELTGLARGDPPPRATEARNDFGRQGWSGPCPPAGTHDYDFRLFALAQPSGVAAGADGAQAAQRVESARALASATLRGTAAAP